MKKMFIISFVLVCLFSSCKVSFVPNTIGTKEEIVLPSGKYLSYEEIERIEKIENDNSFIQNLRTADYNVTEEEIQQMIDLLEKEFGNASILYYGEVSDEYQYIENAGVSNSRAATLGPGSITGKVVLTKHWGPWWCYCTLKMTTTIRTETNNEVKYLPNSVTYIYRDCISTKEGSSDWSWLDNPDELSKYDGATGGWMTGDKFFGQIELEIAQASRGTIDARGDTKYGFFPSIKEVHLSCTFHDTITVERNHSFSYSHFF